MINNKINFHSVIYNLLIFLSLISIFGAVVYRLYSLNNIGVIISLILTVISLIIILRFQRIYNKKNNFTEKPVKAKFTYSAFSLLLLFCFMALWFSCFFVLFSRQTTQAIISPWQALPDYFFLLYALLTAILFLTIKRFNNLAVILISFHYFLSFSIALIIYKIGYGFDPFIHRTTVSLIDKIGSVDPKPFYYLGQYSLITILHKITAVPITLLDKLLVPLLASIYLPIISWRVLSERFEDKKTAVLTVLASLIIPFSFFIVTTPQNLAYLFLILAILLGLSCKNILDLSIIFLLSLAALSIHPIAGIPAVLFSLALTAYHGDNKRIKKYFYSLIFLLTSTVLPLAFYLMGNQQLGAADGISGEQAKNIIPWPKLIVPNEENIIYNLVYLYGFNIKLIIALLAAAGLAITYKYRRECKIFSVYILMSAGLLLSYFLTKLVAFNFLIDYERDNYTNRILLMASFFLLPFILTALYGFIHKTLKQNLIIKTSLFVFLTALITASLYLAYPSFDPYFNSHGVSTGQNDIEAVRWIEETAGQDYIVLANQQVSAAALGEFGFKKYYKNDIFYYPVPTGGPLYQYYLDMVYDKPSRQTALAAMELGGVETGYFILNKYWWAFPKILDEAKLEADSWREFGSGEVYVFKYVK